MRKGKSYGAAQVVHAPRHTATRPLPIPIIAEPTSELTCPCPDGKDAAPVPAARQDSPDGAVQLSRCDVSAASGTKCLSRSVVAEKNVKYSIVVGTFTSVTQHNEQKGKK